MKLFSTQLRAIKATTGEVNSKRAKKNGVIRANVNYDNVNYN